MYDLIIIGGGPGGVAAGIYAARKKMKTALVTDTFGGQSLVSNGIQNWIGTKSISGFDLAKVAGGTSPRAGGNRHYRWRPRPGRRKKRRWHVFRDNEERQDARNEIYSARFRQSRRKRLGVPGEDQFDGKGVVFCTTCDAPLFGGKTVAVVGGGNSALEGVIDLLHVCVEDIFDRALGGIARRSGHAGKSKEPSERGDHLECGG